MKYKVIFWETQFTEPGQLEMMTVFYDDETNKITSESASGNSSIEKYLYPYNNIIGKGGKVYTMEDGMDFMKNLKYAFSGSMVRAGDVEKVE